MTEEMGNAQAQSQDRRGFLTTTGAVVAAGGLLFGDWSPAQAASLPKRILGRTGLNVTVLSFGGIQLSDASHRRVVDHAIASGINYIHTCPGYTGGKSIQVIGEVMRTKRDKVYLAVKTHPGDVDNCLRTLNTDHIDVLIPDDRNNSDEERAAYAALRKAGKIRYAGFAAHDAQAQRLRDTFAAGWRDVMLCAYNLGNRAQLDPVINEAVKSQKMGFMAMKVNGGNGTFAEKLQKLIKGNPNIHTLTPGMNSVQQVDENIAAITEAFAMWSEPEARPASTCVGHNCTLCGACAKACPHGVALMDYMRADLYHTRGDVTLAADLVRSIPTRHSLAACTKCGHCNHACQQQLDVMDIAQRVAHI